METKSDRLARARDQNFQETARQMYGVRIRCLQESSHTVSSITELLEGKTPWMLTLKMTFFFLFLTIRVIYVHCIKFEKLRQEPRIKFIVSVIIPLIYNHSLLFFCCWYVRLPLESSFLFLNS